MNDDEIDIVYELIEELSVTYPTKKYLQTHRPLFLAWCRDTFTLPHLFDGL